MPRQWKLIAIYMVVAYLAFVAAINVAKHQVMDAEQTQDTSAPAR